jgi:hypothetical protein
MSLLPDATKQKLPPKSGSNNIAAAVDKLTPDETQRVKLLLDLSALSDDGDHTVSYLAKDPII